jgi:hypothetical protein
MRLQNAGPLWRKETMKLRRSTVTVITVTMLTLSACTHDQDKAALTDATRSTSAQTRTKDTSPSPSPAEARTGSDRADVGVAYPYDLPAHCKPVYATFAGRTWKVEQPVADPPGEPFARGSINYLRGTMQLTAEDRLRFTVDATSPVIPDAVVTFRPTTESPPLCH